MKVLFVQATDWIKRNPVQQHHLAEMLSLRGHQIRAIDYEILWRTQGTRELYSRQEIFAGVSKIHEEAEVTVVRPGIIKLPMLHYVSLAVSFRRAIDRQIHEFAPDVVVGLGIASYLASRAAERHGLPCIHYWIDVSHRLIPCKLLRPLGWLIERQTEKRVDRVLAINDKLADYAKKLGAAPERTQVLRAGIDIRRFNLETSGDIVRHQYGIEATDFVLLFMGWLYNFSGLKEVALELARVKKPYLKLLIVGEGDAYDQLQRIGEQHDLQDRVILTGKKPYQDMPGFIAASDVCLLPACPDEKIMQDIVPIKMYEYMAMRKPVIATRLPGVMKEFGVDNGVIYVDRPEDVVGNAIELVRNGALNDLGGKARRFVERNSWDNITDEFESILHNVIREKQNGHSS